MRRKGVQTDLRRAIDSAHCPQCGAPESDVASHACEFCGSVLNEGRHDWVLSEYHDVHSNEAQSWLAKTQTAAPTPAVTFPDDAVSPTPDLVPSDADVLEWSISVLAEDKRIDDRERKVIEQLAARQRMPRPMLLGMLDGALRGDLDAPQPKNSDTRRAWLERVADVALQDGDVDADERAVLGQLGKRAGLAGYDINLLINKRRSLRFRQAKGLIRESTDKQQFAQTNRVMLEALCCLMAADGKATKAERDAIVNVLRRAGVLMSSQEIEQAIADFVSRVKSDGLQQVFDRCLEDVGRYCTDPASRTDLRRALHLVAKSDGAAHRREQAVIARFLSACEPEKK
jgi:tellurite resistance protein